MTKGWYGNSHKHSLASKGIRVKARGVEIEGVKLFPHSYQTIEFDMLKFYFDKEGKDVLFIPTDELTQKLLKFTTKHNMQTYDRDGNKKDIDIGSIRLMLVLNPDAITELAQHVFNRKVYGWGSVESNSKVTEYYPSLMGKVVELEYRPFGEPSSTKVGKIINETIKEDTLSNYGDETLYSIELEDGKIMENIRLYDIEEIDGVKPEKLMIYREKEKIVKGQEENL